MSSPSHSSPTPPSGPPAVAALAGVTFTWPDGTRVVTGFDLLVPTGRSALVGTNGAGKSTLLRLLSGDLAPTAGRVAVTGRIGHLPQELTRDVAEPVESFLGIAETLHAVRSIEAGTLAVDDYATALARVGDEWDIAERAVAALARTGLPSDMLGRTLGELSGGEVVQLGLTKLLLDRPDVLLLDEPMNNLDADARARLLAVLDNWTGSLLVVSHDDAFLDDIAVDRVLELTP